MHSWKRYTALCQLQGSRRRYCCRVVRPTSDDVYVPSNSAIVGSFFPRRGEDSTDREVNTSISWRSTKILFVSLVQDQETKTRGTRRIANFRSRVNTRSLTVKLIADSVPICRRNATRENASSTSRYKHTGVSLYKSSLGRPVVQCGHRESPLSLTATWTYFHPSTKLSNHANCSWIYSFNLVCLYP